MRYATPWDIRLERSDGTMRVLHRTSLEFFEFLAHSRIVF